MSEILRRKTNFVLKSRCSLKKKKKRSSPKFGLLFLAVPHHHLSKFPDFAQIFHIAAQKTMVLPKYFLLTARKILILPKFSKLEGAIAPPAPPAGTAMVAVSIKLRVTEGNRNTVAFPLQQRKKSFPTRCLFEVFFCIFAWPSLHKTHFESK